jgi:hypothetical protein
VYSSWPVRRWWFDCRLPMPPDLSGGLCVNPRARNPPEACLNGKLLPLLISAPGFLPACWGRGERRGPASTSRP